MSITQSTRKNWKNIKKFSIRYSTKRKEIKMIVKILGVGCSSCKKLEQNAEEAVKSLGIEAEIIKIEDIQEITSLGIMSVPALMEDGNVLSTGKVLSVSEVKKLLGGKKKSIVGKIVKAVKDSFGCACDNK